MLRSFRQSACGFYLPARKAAGRKPAGSEHVSYSLLGSTGQRCGVGSGEGLKGDGGGSLCGSLLGAGVPLCGGASLGVVVCVVHDILKLLCKKGP